MKQKHYLILGIIIVAVIVVAIFVDRYTTTEIYILTENPVVINTETSGVPSSAMDLVLIATQFSEDRTSEITVRISKREGYPIEGVNWADTTAGITLPDGFELIEGDLNWQGDIIGDDIKEFKIKVKAVENGEWIVEANAKYMIYEDNWWGDIERFYILVKDDEVLISDRSFTPVNPKGKAESA